jgi:lauroyl/myristoyl acyltransferase
MSRLYGEVNFFGENKIMMTIIREATAESEAEVVRMICVL